MYKIYGIMYIPEQKIIYVGQTSHDLQYRFAGHLYNSYGKGETYFRKMSVFIRSVKIHDLDIVLIEDGIKTLEEADKREQYWIKVYDTYYNGMNSTLGGHGKCTIPFEVKEKMVEDYENGKPPREIGKEHNQPTGNITRILIQERGVKKVWKDGLQPPPFYIYNLPWDVVIPNDGTQPLQIF